MTLEEIKTRVREIEEASEKAEGIAVHIEYGVVVSFVYGAPMVESQRIRQRFIIESLMREENDSD